MRLELKEPSLCRAVVAAMWQPDLIQDLEVKKQIENFRNISSESGIFSFDAFTKYYSKEMGLGLRKVFFTLEGFFHRDELIELKKKAYLLEEAHMSNGKRVINIDPMLVSLENVVIATSKNFSHRLYLGQGVFGDLAFIFRDGHFQPLPWTYPDYIAQVQFLEKVRAELVRGS